MPSIQNFIQDIDGRLGFLSVVVKMVQIEAILNEALLCKILGDNYNF